MLLHSLQTGILGRTPIESKLLYGTNAFFSSLSPRNKLLLFRQSKSAISSLYDLPPWAHTSPLFRRLNVLPLGQAAAKQMLSSYIVALATSQQPMQPYRPILLHFFTSQCSEYSTSTRGSEQRLLEIPFWPGSSGRKNIKSYGTVRYSNVEQTLPLPYYELFNHSPSSGKS